MGLVIFTSVLLPHPYLWNPSSGVPLPLLYLVHVGAYTRACMCVSFA